MNVPALEALLLRLRNAVRRREGLAAAGAVLVTLLLSTLAYVASGRRAIEVLSTNLPPEQELALLTTGHPTEPGPLATAFEVTFAGPGRDGGGKSWPREARVEIQLDTQGRALRLSVSSAEGDGSERTVRAVDRDWVDLGPMPPGFDSRSVRIRAMGGHSFGIVRPVRFAWPDLRRIEARITDGTWEGGVPNPPRYRIVVSRPVPPGEALARLLAFPGMSWVLGVALLLGVASAVGGAALVFRAPLPASLLLVVGVGLVHASLRPPLHGEDESSHVGTVEVVVLAPEKLAQISFPQSVARLGKATDIDRVQYRPDEVLPVDSAAHRTAVREATKEPGTELARLDGNALLASGVQPVDARAPLYYRAFAVLRPFASHLGLLDRVALYRLFSTALAVAAFAGGALLLAFAFPARGKTLLYALAALVPPYLMSLATTVSNYALAIGLGQLMAAALVATIAGERRPARLVAAVVLFAATLAGVGVYRDFAAFLAATGFLAALGGPVLLGAWAWRRGGTTRALGLAVATALPLGAALLVWTMLLSRPERMARLTAFVLARKPTQMPAFDDPVWSLAVKVVLAPMAFGLVLAALSLLGRRLDLESATRLARVRVAAGLGFALWLWLTAEFAPVPFETTWLDFHEEILFHWNAFRSTLFSFDQDVLSWKMYWGVFGWADTRYPVLVYALAKWACVALLLALPVLCVKTQRERPWASALLLVFAGLATTLAVASNVARYFSPTNPWGRFVLPWVPLALFAALARIDLDERRERALKWLLVAAACFHLWTAVYVVGVRYFIPR